MKRLSRLFIAIGLTIVALPIFLASASAVSTTYLGLGNGLVVYGTTGPYEQAFVRNTTAGPTYCISIDTPIYPGDVLNEGSFTEAVAAAPGGELTEDNLKQIVRIVRNTFPNNNPSYPLAGNDDQKAASVQSAVWSYSNTWELDPSNPLNDATVIANYNLIRSWLDGDASNGELPEYTPAEPPASLEIDPANASAVAGGKAGPFTVKIQDGTSKVKVTVTDGIAVDSLDNPIDPNYEYSNNEQFYIQRDTAGTATAEIAGQVNSSPGRVFIPEIEGNQLLISVVPFEGDSQANATAEFTEDENTTTTTEPDVEGTIVTRPPEGGTTPQVVVGGTQVQRGTLAETGLNGLSVASFAMGIAMIILGLTLTSLRRLGMHSA